MMKDRKDDTRYWYDATGISRELLLSTAGLISFRRYYYIKIQQNLSYWQFRYELTYEVCYELTFVRVVESLGDYVACYYHLIHC